MLVVCDSDTRGESDHERLFNARRTELNSKHPEDSIDTYFCPMTKIVPCISYKKFLKLEMELVRLHTHRFSSVHSFISD